jgi:hypothetical protein
MPGVRGLNIPAPGSYQQLVIPHHRKQLVSAHLDFFLPHYPGDKMIYFSGTYTGKYFPFLLYQSYHLLLYILMLSNLLTQLIVILAAVS